MTNLTTAIRINEGTIVARKIDGHRRLGRWVPVTLVGDVYVEAYRDYDGSWVYSVGKQQYCCAGGLATVQA
jgi:hypothetical protein